VTAMMQETAAMRRIMLGVLFAWAAVVLCAPLLRICGILRSARCAAACGVTQTCRSMSLWFCGMADYSERHKAAIDKIVQAQLHERLRWLAILMAEWILPLSAIVVLRSAIAQATVGDLLARLIPVFIMVPGHALTLLCYFGHLSFTRPKFRVVYGLFILRELAVMSIEPSHCESGDVGCHDLETRLLLNALGRLWASITVRDVAYSNSSHVLVMAAYLLLGYAEGVTHVRRSFSFAMAFFSVIAIAITSTIERQNRESVKRHLEAEAQEQHSEAAGCLLSSMCDAVVYLSDQSFEVVAGYQKLAALLLRADVFAAPQKACFLDTIATDSDRDAFAAFVERPCNDFAQTAHISLRDSTSTPFSVQVYHVRGICRESMQPVHIIGLCDAGDAVRQVPVSATAAELTEKQVAAFKSAPLRPSACGSYTCGSVHSSDMGPEMAQHLDTRAKELNEILAMGSEAMVLLEPFHLAMVRWSAAFATIFFRGSSAVKGASFLDLVVKEDRWRFLQEFQNITQDMLFEDQESVNDAGAGAVALARQGSAASSREASMEVNVSTLLHGKVTLSVSIFSVAADDAYSNSDQSSSKRSRIAAANLKEDEEEEVLLGIRIQEAKSLRSHERIQRPARSEKPHCTGAELDASAHVTCGKPLLQL